MAKKNFDGGLFNLKKEPLTSDGKPDGKPLIIRDIIVDSLLAQMPGEDSKAKEKVDRYKLAVRLSDGGEQEVAPEEIVLMKNLVGKNYGPLVVGQIFALLDA